jgi:hypothetical protein
MLLELKLLALPLLLDPELLELRLLLLGEAVLAAAPVVVPAVPDDEAKEPVHWPDESKLW